MNAGSPEGFGAARDAFPSEAPRAVPGFPSRRPPFCAGRVAAFATARALGAPLATCTASGVPVGAGANSTPFESASAGSTAVPTGAATDPGSTAPTKLGSSNFADALHTRTPSTSATAIPMLAALASSTVSAK